MREDILNEITELQIEIERLEKEYESYKHDIEASEPIKYNIDKRKWQIEDLIKPTKEELKQKEKIKNNQIEEITKEAEDRIARLEKEYESYKHDIETSEPIKHNINRIKLELEEKIKCINEQYEDEKNSILDEIEKTGIDLEEYNLKEKEKLEEIEDNSKVEKNNEELEKGTSKTANPISANPISANKTVQILGNTKAVLKDDLEIIELNKEEKNKENSNSVRIFYSAKTDKYIVTNVNIKEQKIVPRREIEKLDKNLLAEKMQINIEELESVDTNILQLLLNYDKTNKTTKASEYLKTVTQIGRSKEERQHEMQENEIEIEYNLKGIYDKHEEDYEEYEYNFSKEDREELLKNANNAKTRGVATVKKGFYVRIREIIDSTTRKFTTNKLLRGKSTNALPEGIENSENENQRVNQKYLDSLSEKWNKNLETYKKEQERREEKEHKTKLKEAQKEKKFKDKIRIAPEKMHDKVNINETIEKMNAAVQEKMQEMEEK